MSTVALTALGTAMTVAVAVTAGKLWTAVFITRILTAAAASQ